MVGENSPGESFLLEQTVDALDSVIGICKGVFDAFFQAAWVDSSLGCLLLEAGFIVVRTASHCLDIVPPFFNFIISLDTDLSEILRKHILTCEMITEGTEFTRTVTVRFFELICAFRTRERIIVGLELHMVLYSEKSYLLMRLKYGLNWTKKSWMV